MSKTVDVNIINQSTWIEENGLGIAALILAILTFIIERYISNNREVKNDKYSWFLTVIVVPKLNEIANFYNKTCIDLISSMNTMQELPDSVSVTERLKLKRQKINEFKKSRQDFFNNFVSMSNSYDRSLGVKIDKTINLIDDIYSNAMDKPTFDKSEIRKEIYRNQTILYKLLFQEIKKD